MSRNNYTKVQLLELMEKAFLCMSDDYQETKGKLQQAGFHCLGSGNYGSAWSHKDVKGWCIKVCGRVDGDSYPAYVHWAMANPMPGVPEFKFATFSPQHDVFMVMLPQYLEYECAEYRCNADPAATRFDRDFFSAKAACYGRVQDCHDRPLNDAPVTLAGIKAGEFFGDLVQWDLHDGNFMIDDELDILIMTDPIHCGNNNHLIAKVYSRDAVVKSWGHQMKLEFPIVRPPVPEFLGEFANLCDNADDAMLRAMAVPINRGQRHGFGNPQMFNIPKIRIPDLPPGKHEGKIQWNPDMALMDFAALEQRVARHHDKRPFAQRTRARQDKREARLAYWVRECNLKPEQVRKLGEAAQDWPDHRIHGCGGVVQFAIMPEREPCFLPRGAALPDERLMVQNIRIPAEILATLRDWWQVEQQNRDRAAWGGRFARQVNQFRNFIR
jgi:hypothetical protein